LHVPMSKEIMNIYEYVPVSLQQTEQFLMIRSQTKHIAVNLAGTQFFEITNLTTCDQIHHLTLCPEANIRRKEDVNKSCLVSMYFQRTESIAQNCLTFPAPQKVSVQQIGPQGFVLYASNAIRTYTK